jgi:hypothetical protein
MGKKKKFTAFSFSFSFSFHGFCWQIDFDFWFSAPDGMISIFVLSLLCYRFLVSGVYSMWSHRLWGLLAHVSTCVWDDIRTKYKKLQGWLSTFTFSTEETKDLPGTQPTPSHCSLPHLATTSVKTPTPISKAISLPPIVRRTLSWYPPHGITPINQPGSLILGIKQNTCFVCLWGMILWMAMFVVYRCAVSCPVF